VAIVITAAKAKAVKRGAVRKLLFMVGSKAASGVSMHAVSASEAPPAGTVRRSVSSRA
jgi:hypothetical protein